MLFHSSRGGKPEVSSIQWREDNELVEKKGILKYSTNSPFYALQLQLCRKYAKAFVFMRNGFLFLYTDNGLFTSCSRWKGQLLPLRREISLLGKESNLQHTSGWSQSQTTVRVRWFIFRVIDCLKQVLSNNWNSSLAFPWNGKKKTFQQKGYWPIDGSTDIWFLLMGYS